MAVAVLRFYGFAVAALRFDGEFPLELIALECIILVTSPGSFSPLLSLCQRGRPQRSSRRNRVPTTERDT